MAAREGHDDGGSLEGLHLLAIVLFANSPEAVNTPLLDQILEARLPPVISPTIVPLRGHNCLDSSEDILLGHISQSICQSCKGIIVPAPTTSAWSVPNSVIHAQ